MFAVASDPLEIDYESSVAQAFIFHLISIVFIIRCAEDIEENKHTPRVHYFFSPFELRLRREIPNYVRPI